MSIEELYQDFIESDCKDGILADLAVQSADSHESAVLIADSIEDELHKGFVFGFIAGISFMKGVIR